MKRLLSDRILESKVLNKYAYTVIYEPESDINITRILDKNKDLYLSEQKDAFYIISGCSFNISLPKYYDVLFDIDNIESCIDVQCEIKEVFALGFRAIGEIPANWNVSALIHFQDDVPLCLRTSTLKYCLSSRELWQEVLNL